MNRKLRLPMALALALGSSHVLALGLGQVEVKSALYEPLEAEIPVLSSTPGEAEALTVRLASPEAFARVGLERPQTLATNLQFSIGENARGQKVIRITTRDRVNDPFLNFLVEADWGKGRLLREFTVLLDPPTSAPASRAAAVTPLRDAPAAAAEPIEQPAPSPQSAPATTQAAAPTPRAAAAPAAAPSAPSAPAPTSAPAALQDEYSVAAGDTLWSIAQRNLPDASVSVNQMMIALLRANPDAFIDENINRIKRGAVLRMPDRAALEAVSSAESAALVREQMDAWRANQPQLQPAEAEPAAAGTRSTAARTPESRLELVPPRGDQPAEGAVSGVDAQSGAGTELRAELARAREEVGARDQEIRELRSRVGELEGLRSDSERLISMKDTELAALQRRLAQLEAERQAQADAASAADGSEGAAPGAILDDASTTAAGDQATPPGEGAILPPAIDPAAEGSDDAARAEQAAGDRPDGAMDDSAAGDAASPVLPPAATPSDRATTAAAADAAAAPTEPMPERGAQPWYRNLWLLGGIGLVVAGLLAFLLGRRRRDDEPRARNYDTGALAGSMGADPNAAPALDEDGYDTVPLETEREGALLDALAEQPEDLGRHLDLARYYYEQGDADAFEGAAEAMYAQIYDPDDMMWKQVVAMGRELLPDHPLFTVPADVDAVDGDTGTEADEGAAQVDWEAGSFRDQGIATPDALGTDHGISDSAREDVPAPPPAASDVEWDGETDNASTQQFRFEDLEHGSDRAGAAPAPPAEDVDAVTGQDASADASAYEYGGGDDAASTKLELARAYLDMGDVEGARGMLEEVMTEGNPGQRAESRRLLDEIR